jgi:hypothetical protein
VIQDPLRALVEERRGRVDIHQIVVDDGFKAFLRVFFGHVGEVPRADGLLDFLVISAFEGGREGGREAEREGGRVREARGVDNCHREQIACQNRLEKKGREGGRKGGRKEGREGGHTC